MEEPSYTLAELAALVQARAVGGEETAITGVAGIKEARQGDITFIADPRYIEFLETTDASAVIRTDDVPCALPSIISTNPYLAFIKVMSYFADAKTEKPEGGVHKTAIVDPTARLSGNVSVGPFCQIGRRAQIGDNTKVFFGAYIGADAILGSDCLVYPNVTIREKCEIGSRVIIHPGAVIGSDGFGFARDGGRHVKIPQIGKVVVEDDVEIGSNSTIDRATTGVTRICEGTKIDNLVQIAHNCTVGKHSILAGQVGLAGSAATGEGVVMAGQSGLVGHITLGDGVTVGAKTAVTKSLPDGVTVSGFPAREHRLARKIYAYTGRLPELFDRIKKLEKRIAELEKEKGE